MPGQAQRVAGQRAQKAILADQRYALAAQGVKPPRQRRQIRTAHRMMRAHRPRIALARRQLLPLGGLLYGGTLAIRKWKPAAV